MGGEGALFPQEVGPRDGSTAPCRLSAPGRSLQDWELPRACQPLAVETPCTEARSDTSMRSFSKAGLQLGGSVFMTTWRIVPYVCVWVY